MALITGGDSGIGRAIAVLFAREGADVAISYLSERDDAERTREHVLREGRDCLLLEGDIRESAHCCATVKRTTDLFGRLDVLVNNAGEQHPADRLDDLTDDNLWTTFETNVFAMFYFCRAALPALRASPHGSIINTASVTAYRGSDHLVDYAASKGAIVSFTRSLSKQLVSQKIRVNAVAPGPVWTPLIPASFSKELVATFGADVPMARVAQPAEIAPAFLYLACDDSSYVTGQVLHVNGGEVVNG